MAIADREGGSAERVDAELGLGERALSAAVAALLSALVVNPLDVAEAQAAGFPHKGVCSMPSLDMLLDLRGYPYCARAIIDREAVCYPECGQYKGTLDVFYKIIRQEGVSGLWRGTYASLAMAVPTNLQSSTPYVPLFAGSTVRTLACISCYPIELARTLMQAFKEVKNGPKSPGMWKTLLEVVNLIASSNNHNSPSKYRILWTGLGAQLAFDVPFYAICWSTLEPLFALSPFMSMRRKILDSAPSEESAASVLCANFAAGFTARVLAAAATFPLDAPRTRRQIEKDTTRALKMTTRQILAEIWRDGGIEGLFAGVVPWIARDGPSVRIVVSFYEVVKYALHQTYYRRY